MANPLVVNPYLRRKYTKEELANVPDMRPAIGEVGKGVRAFADEAQATGYGLYALGAQHLKDAFGGKPDGFLDRQVQTGIEGYQRNIEEATAGRQAPNVARVEDIKGLGDFTDWAAYNLAKGIPQLATTLAGGGVGGAVAKATAKKQVKDMAKDKLAKGVTKQMQEQAKEELRKRTTRGVVTGGFGAGAGYEAGHMMGQGVEEGVDPSTAAKAATVGGGINGALEFLPIYGVAKKLGMGDFAKKRIRDIIKNDAGLSKRAIALATAKEAGRRAGAAGVVGAGAEGLTEGLQELVNIAALRWAKDEPLFAQLEEDDWSQVLNATAAGGLIGGVAAGGGGVVVGPQGQEEVVAPPAPAAEAPVAPVPPVTPPPGTEGVVVGDPTITPMHPERKEAQPQEPGLPALAAQNLPATQPVPQPRLEQQPLQGELVDPGTGLVSQEQRPAVESPFIDGTARAIEDAQIAEQLKLEEQKKLPAPNPRLADLTMTDQEVDEEGETPQLIYREYVKKDGTAFASESAAKGMATRRGLDNFSVVPVEGGFALRDNGPLPQGAEVLESRARPTTTDINVQRLMAELRQMGAEDIAADIEQTSRLPLNELKADTLRLLRQAQKEAGIPSLEVLSQELESRARPPMFHSKVAQTVSAAPQPKMAGKQWAGWLSKQPGVKPEEIEDLGLQAWLDSREGAVSKEEVAQFVEAGGVQLEEVVKGKARENVSDEEVLAEYQIEQGPSGKFYLTQAGKAVSSPVDTERQAIQLGRSMILLRAKTEGGGVKYEDYQVSGGENYRELLLTLPERLHPVEALRKEREKLEEQLKGLKDIYGNDVYPFELVEEDGIIVDDNSGGEVILTAEQEQLARELLKITSEIRRTPSGTTDENFRSSHFDEPNILAHIRFNEREVDGERVLFVEEVQSDWHQKGRKEGYAGAAKKPEITDLDDPKTLAEFDRLEAEYDKTENEETWKALETGRYLYKQLLDNKLAAAGLPHKFMHTVDGWVIIDGRSVQASEIGSPQEAYDSLDVNTNTLEGKAPGVPNAPFKQAWPMLAMKRMIHWAAENGFDRVAWTDGQTQADRYDLSAQISHIDYNKNGDGTFNVTGVDHEGIAVLNELNVKEDKLAEIIGKELVDKITKGEGKAAPNGEFDVEGSKRLEGVDLKVGGEGMKAFYDKGLPRAINKYLKQWGVKVEQAPFKVGKSREQIERDQENPYMLIPVPATRQYRVDNLMDESETLFDTRREAQAFIDQSVMELNTTEQTSWSFPITQQMKDDVLANGQPLYSEPKAARATPHSAASFEYDFSNMFGRGVFKDAIESGFLTINEQSPEGAPAGSFNKETNQITLNLDKIGEGESPMSVLLHEGRHAGMQEVLGESLPLFHQDLLNLADRGNQDAQSSIIRSTAAVADKLGIEHQLYDISLPQNEIEAEVKALRRLIGERDIGPELLQEEDLAYYIQDSANTVNLSAPGLFRRIMNALKVWWAQSSVGQMFAQAGVRAELTPEMAVELAKAALNKSLARALEQEAGITDLAGWVKEESKRVRSRNDLESIPNPLNSIKRWWGESSDTPLDANDIGWLGKVRAHIIDNLATIDEKSTDVHKVAEVAKSKTSAEQSKINRLYLKPLVELAKATGLNQQQLDDWLLARHVLFDDENWQNTRKRSWMFARDLAKNVPTTFRKELDERRLSLTKENVWIDKEGKSHNIPETQVPDRMIDLVNEYFTKMEDLKASGALNPKFTAWEKLQSDWVKVQAHSAGMYSPGKVDANGQLLAGQPKRANPSNAPDAYDIYHSYHEDGVQWQALQNMAKKWDEMTKHQLDLLVEGGKISHEEAIHMREAHPHYVKTRRKSADNAKSFEFLKGRSPGAGKPKVRAGTIEYDPVVHVMQSTLAQAHANAAAAQQNQAAKYLYHTIEGDKDHWKGWFETAPEQVHHLDKYGFLHDRPTTRPNDFDIPVTLMTEKGGAGKTIYIRPVAQNEKAELFAAGFNKLGAQQQGSISKVLAFGNKIVRSMAVTFSPAFLAANIVRDPSTAFYNLQATEGKDYTKDFLFGGRDAVNGNDAKGKGRTGLGQAWRILRSVYTDRENADPKHVEWVEEWEHAGGRQSFTQALKEMDEGWQSFETELKIAQTPGVSHAFKGLEWVEKYNIIVENMSRFSAYSTVMEAWERGDIPKWKTKEKAQREAAIISKELTTNFDRKGFSSQAIGLWHLFFNATVQGNVQVLRNLRKSGKLQKMVGGTLITAILWDMLGRMTADEDDEGRNEWDNIPDYVKERNIIIPFKIGGQYWKIPAPWVYNTVWRTGGMIGEWGAGSRDAASVPVDMALMLRKTFNPLESASLLQSLSPTALTPFVQARENMNFAGNPLKPTSFPGAAALPESQLYWDTTPKFYVGLAQALNSIGGDVAHSGFIDVSPGVLHNYVNFFTAGVGNAAGQVYTMLGKSFDERKYETRDVPILSTFAHTPGAQMDVQLYHDRVAQVLNAEKAVQLYGEGKTRDLEKQREARQKYAQELRMVGQVKDVEKQLKSLRVRLRAAQGRKDTAGAEAIKKRITAVQQRFNESFERRIK